MIAALIPILGLTSAARADFVASFDNRPLAPNSANENPGPGSFQDSVGNTYNNTQSSFGSFNFWSGGWAISNITNTANPGGAIPDFQFIDTAITGRGSQGHTNYGLATTFGEPGQAIIDLAAGASPVSIDVTNSAYAYYAMKLGDTFLDPFSAGDFFLLTIKGYASSGGAGNLIGSPVNFYLGNFLKKDDGTYNSIIVDTWQPVDLSPLAGARSLVFSLSSSQNNAQGMLTPGFFAADSLKTTLAAVPEPTSLVLCLSGLGIMGVMHRRRRGPAALPARHDELSEITR